MRCSVHEISKAHGPAKAGNRTASNRNSARSFSRALFQVCQGPTILDSKSDREKYICGPKVEAAFLKSREPKTSSKLLLREYLGTFPKHQLFEEVSPRKPSHGLESVAEMYICGAFMTETFSKSYTQIQPEKRSYICARTFSLLFEKVDARKSTFTGVKSTSANDNWTLGFCCEHWELCRWFCCLA